MADSWGLLYICRVIFNITVQCWILGVISMRSSLLWNTPLLQYTMSVANLNSKSGFYRKQSIKLSFRSYHKCTSVSIVFSSSVALSHSHALPCSLSPSLSQTHTHTHTQWYLRGLGKTSTRTIVLVAPPSPCPEPRKHPTAGHSDSHSSLYNTG